MILFEVAKFADSACVARTIGVLTVSAHLTPTHAMVAFVTLSFRVEWFVRVRAVRYLPLAYFQSFFLHDFVPFSFYLLL